YALGLFSAHDPELLIGARLNAPLVVGLGEGEFFLASDITAIIPYTKQVLVLGEGQVVAITPLGATVTTLDGHAVAPQIIHVDWEVSQAEKGGYPHYMLKEIHETAEAAANASRGRMNELGEVCLAEFEIEAARLRQIDELLLLGMGTSMHAAMIGEQVIEEWVGIRARAADSSEFRYRRWPVNERTLAAVLTQSGETADTIVALREAHEQGALTLALTNVVASTAAREADGTIYLQAGPEIGVCSTKTFIAQLLSLYLLALRLVNVRGSLTEQRQQELAFGLRELPSLVRRVLDSEQQIAELAARYADYPNFIYVGRGVGYPVAMEGALKLKEISYLHAEGLSGGALKHGTIALLDHRFPVVAICTESLTREKMISNV
ncbi:MAG: isomerizing glutamine--fructose-6-phosphate transaminase, partial [Candidatus Dormibacteraceae bacterium]